MVLYNWCWRCFRSTTVSIDSLDEDVLDINHVAFDDGVSFRRRLTLVVDMAKGVVQLEVRVAEGASAEENREDD